MDQLVDVPPPVIPPESPPVRTRNVAAHVGSRLGIVGAALVFVVMALGAWATILAATTPDFMPDDITDDPFVGTALACLVPPIVGWVGFCFAVAGLTAVRSRGERGVAVRGFVLSILTIVLPIVIAGVMIGFDAQVSACGGG